jgi:GcrA cell cycle regulator
MNDCRWPIGDPQHADFHFCGAPRASGRPYCQAHTQASIQPSKPRYPQAPAVAELIRRAA